MDNIILKKKLSTFKSASGRLLRISPDVLLEVLRAWESWTGNSKEFYRSIGVGQKQMAKILGKAKKLCRDGAFPAEEFKEISLPAASISAGVASNVYSIELAMETGKLIRFGQVEQLVEFLKKAA